MGRAGFSAFLLRRNRFQQFGRAESSAADAFDICTARPESEVQW